MTTENTSSDVTEPAEDTVPLGNPWDVMEKVWFLGQLDLLFHPEVPDTAVLLWLDRALQNGEPAQSFTSEGFVLPSVEGVAPVDVWRDQGSAKFYESDPDLAWKTAPAVGADIAESTLDEFGEASKVQGWAKVDLWLPHLFQNATGLKVSAIWDAVGAGAVAALSEDALWWMMQEADSTLVERTVNAMQDIVVTGRARSTQLASSLFFLGFAGKNKDGGHRIWQETEQVRRIAQIRTRIAPNLARLLDPTGGLVGLPFHMLFDVATSTWAVDVNRPAWKALLEADPSKQTGRR